MPAILFHRLGVCLSSWHILHTLLTCSYTNSGGPSYRNVNSIDRSQILIVCGCDSVFFCIGLLVFGFQRCSKQPGAHDLLRCRCQHHNCAHGKRPAELVPPQTNADMLTVQFGLWRKTPDIFNLLCVVARSGPSRFVWIHYFAFDVVYSHRSPCQDVAFLWNAQCMWKAEIFDIIWSLKRAAQKCNQLLWFHPISPV